MFEPRYINIPKSGLKDSRQLRQFINEPIPPLERSLPWSAPLACIKLLAQKVLVGDEEHKSHVVQLKDICCDIMCLRAQKLLDHFKCPKVYFHMHLSTFWIQVATDVQPSETPPLYLQMPFPHHALITMSDLACLSF